MKYNQHNQFIMNDEPLAIVVCCSLDREGEELVAWCLCIMIVWCPVRCSLKRLLDSLLLLQTTMLASNADTKTMLQADNDSQLVLYCHFISHSHHVWFTFVGTSSRTSILMNQELTLTCVHLWTSPDAFWLLVLMLMYQPQCCIIGWCLLDSLLTLW